MSSKNDTPIHEQELSDQLAATENQLNEISNEIKKDQPLTSSLQNITSLKDYVPVGAAEQYICETYSNWRRIRGDGNCYYRAFLYSLCEALTDPSHKNELERLQIYGMSPQCEWLYFFKKYYYK